MQVTAIMRIAHDVQGPGALERQLGICRGQAAALCRRLCSAGLWLGGTSACCTPRFHRSGAGWGTHTA